MSRTWQQNATVYAILFTYTLGVLASLVHGASLMKEELGDKDTFSPVKPPVPWEDLDPIHACLFACNICYKKELMLECANAVCLGSLQLGRPIDKWWSASCPLLPAIFLR